jgi:hypothetical protein
MLRDRKFADSPLEEERFEPSVPRDTTKFSMPAHVTYAWFPARGKVGANESRPHDDAGRLPRNRLFESGVLQRRDGMGQAARKWHHRRCTVTDGVPYARAERLEQVPRRLGPR